MIPNSTGSTVTEAGMEDLETVDMGFDPTALNRIMTVLTHIAADPEAYLLQEYVTNGIDSCIEASQAKPVEVFTPTVLDPKLRIKDYGTGLSKDGVIKTFAFYGYSTKRDSNEYAGYMGIGSKSAFAYAPQFTAIGIKDGKKSIVSISRDEDGGGQVKIEELETDEPNGVEIQVPAQRGNEFQEKAEDILRYCKPGTVILNGKAPEAFDGLDLTDSISFVKKAHYSEEDICVMGNVAYEIPYSIRPLRNLLSGRRMIVRVGVGEVDITPARDSLQETNLTRKRMEKVSEEIRTALQTKVQGDVEAAATPQEAMAQAIQWRSALDNRYEGVSKVLGELKWRGKEVPSIVRPLNAVEGEERNTLIIADTESSKPGEHSREASIPAPTLFGGLLVYGYEAAKFTPSHKRKLEKFAEDIDFEIGHFVLTNEPLDTAWIAPERIVQWDEIKPIKLPRTYTSSTGKVRITGSYPAWAPGADYEREILAEEIDTSHNIYWYTKETFEDMAGYGYRKQERTAENEADAVKVMREIDPDVTIVRLGLNRIEKFSRDFPAAKRLRESLEAHFNSEFEKLDAEALLAYQLQEDGSSLLRKLNPDKIADPDLQSAVRLATMSVDEHVKPFRPVRRTRLGNLLNLKFNEACRNPQVYDLSEHYPLLQEASRRVKDDYSDHTYIYINAVHSYNYAVARAEREERIAA